MSRLWSLSCLCWLGLWLAASGCGPPSEGRIDIGDGRRLYLRCAGRGSPTVVLEAGWHLGADSWKHIQERVASFTRVCAYDRAGQGRSDRAPRLPRSCGQDADDLGSLLRAARLRGPLVLVGHSWGGLVVRVYAGQQPTSVKGMVLVDPLHEEHAPRFVATLSSPHRKWLGWPENAPPDLDLERCFAEARRLGRVPPVPFVVLEADDPRLPPGMPPGFPLDAARALQHRLYSELARQAGDGEVVIARRSTHMIPRDRPDLVVDAIRKVVERARQSSR